MHAWHNLDPIPTQRRRLARTAGGRLGVAGRPRARFRASAEPLDSGARSSGARALRGL